MPEPPSLLGPRYSSSGVGRNDVAEEDDPGVDLIRIGRARIDRQKHPTRLTQIEFGGALHRREGLSVKDTRVVHHDKHTPEGVESASGSVDAETRRPTDHVVVLVAIQTGMRLSELTGLCLGDVHLGGGAHLRCLGKGRKSRCTPLNPQTVGVLKVWVRERANTLGDALFPTRRGARLSADAVARLVAKHVRTAAGSCPSLRAKNVTPHVLRHTNSMQLLQSGVDTATIALWLGHESVRTTDIYLHADMSLKERALARMTPPAASRGRYRPSDALMTFLASP